MERNYVIKMAKSKMYASEDQDHPFTAHLDQAKTYDYPELIDLGMNKLIRQAESKYKDYFGNKDYAYVHQISPEELEKDKTDNNDAVPVPALDDPEDEDEDYALAEMEDLFGEDPDDLDNSEDTDVPSTYFVITVTFKGDPKTYYPSMFPGGNYLAIALSPDKETALVYNMVSSDPNEQVDQITKAINHNPKFDNKEINLVNFKFLDKIDLKKHYINETVRSFAQDLQTKIIKAEIDPNDQISLFISLLYSLADILGDDAIYTLKDCIEDLTED